jgi:hypothetical protein
VLADGLPVSFALVERSPEYLSGAKEGADVAKAETLIEELISMIERGERVKALRSAS